MALRGFLEQREPLIRRRRLLDWSRYDRRERITTRISELEHELATTECEPCKEVIKLKIRGYKRRLAELEGI